MIGSILARTLRVLVQVLLFAVLLSLLASLAFTLGVVDVPGDQTEIETPGQLPDWPLVWEIPVDQPQGPAIDVDRAEPDGEFGDQIEEDPGTTHTGSDDSIASDEIEERVHERINEIRADHDLPPLDHDDDIADISRIHSHDMGERGYFSHVSPEGDAPHDRFGDRFPAECEAVGENLALVGTGTASDADEVAERIVEGWMESDDHRENLLRADWDAQGIGVYIVDGDAYATQKFCEDA